MFACGRLAELRRTRAQHGAEPARRQPVRIRRCRPVDDHRPEIFEHAVDDDYASKQHDQRRHGVIGGIRQHAIINLQDGQRQGERQQIDDGGGNERERGKRRRTQAMLVGLAVMQKLGRKFLQQGTHTE